MEVDGCTTHEVAGQSQFSLTHTNSHIYTRTDTFTHTHTHTTYLFSNIATQREACLVYYSYELLRVLALLLVSCLVEEEEDENEELPFIPGGGILKRSILRKLQIWRQTLRQ